MVVNEAMACGTPAITSDVVGCAPDMIDDGETGFTFPVGNVDALADRMLNLQKLKSAGFEPSRFLSAKVVKYSVLEAAANSICAVTALVRDFTGSACGEYSP